MGSVFNRGTRRDRPRWSGKFRDANGVWKNVATHCATKEEAKRFIAQAESNVAAGRVGIPALPTKEELARRLMTVRELGEKFTSEYSSARLKDPRRYRTITKYLFEKHVYPAVGTVPAAQLTTAQLERLRDKLREEGKLAPQSVRHVLAFTSRMYVWAADKGILDCRNPTSRVEKPRLERDEDDFDFLSADEVANLLAWATQHQSTEFPMYATAVYTGMRLGELCGLRWTDISFERGVIDVRRSYRSTPKSGKGRHVPLNPRLAPILRTWKARCPKTAEGLVFPAPPPSDHGKLSQEEVLEIRTRVANGGRRSVLAREYGVSWTAIAKVVRGERREPSGEPRMRTRDEGASGFKDALGGAGCHEVRFHDLRHTYASNYMMAGGNILTLQRMLGHSSVKVTEKYSHFSPTFLAAEGARLSFEQKTAGVVTLGERRQPAQPG